MVRTGFWTNPEISVEMSPEDKYFYVYLLTNPKTMQIGIYQITKKQIAFDLGYSMESVHSLMERFTLQYKLIRYNPETREVAINNWGKENLLTGGKPIMDCVFSELKEVVDLSLIHYVAKSIDKQEFKSLYESFCNPDEMVFGREPEDNTPYITEDKEIDDTFPCRSTIRGQKEKEKQKEKENKKEKQQQKAFYPRIENNPSNETPIQQTEDVKKMIEFGDENGFGFLNGNAKQQLLSWVDDSHFLQPKAVILKAMKIACANNKRRLNDIIGILKNRENESLLTVEEMDSYQENQKSEHKFNPSTQSFSIGRDIPGEFRLDLTAREEL